MYHRQGLGNIVLWVLLFLKRDMGMSLKPVAFETGFQQDCGDGCRPYVQCKDFFAHNLIRSPGLSETRAL
jgi:hypothetical protein